MASIHLWFLLTLCFHVSNIPCAHTFVSGSVNDFVHQPYSRSCFLKRRIPYNANSCASFQLELLNAGDIHPNPGPDNNKFNTIHYTPTVTNASSELKSTQHVYKYNTAELRKWKDKLTELPHDVLNVITSCGLQPSIPCIRKTRRGNRGGKRRNCHRNECKASLPHRSKDKLDQPQQSVSFCMINTRSIRNKTSEFNDFVIDNDLDVVGVCETWLHPDDDAVIAALNPGGYRFCHTPRLHKRGGGVALLYRSNLDVKVVPSSLNISK